MPTYAADAPTGSTGTVHDYVITADGDYRVECWGAQGGGIGGGKGAYVAGTFALTVADHLWIIVGQRPSGVSGGGGASSVSVGTDLVSSTPLVVAGGGGGCGELPHHADADGRTVTVGTSSNGGDGQGTSGTPGGIGGDCAADASPVASPQAVGASGAGWNLGGGTDGRGYYDDALVDDSGGQALKSGAEGGGSINGSALGGGFGGGGGGYELGAGSGRASGGGGGYNGGGGGHWTSSASTAHRGGGGGSYNGGTDIDGENGSREGSGVVSIRQIVPIPAPVNIEAVVTGHEVTVSWTAPPTPSVWEDDDDVVAEVRRVDCFGETIVGVVQPGYVSGSIVDRFAPLSKGAGPFCGDTGHECGSTYSVRYHGRIARRLDPPDPTVPEGLIVAWPDTEASIPSGWSREADLDGMYIRSIPDDSTDPGATGGAATHVHTTSGHVHSLNHYHSQPNTPGNSSCLDVPYATSPNDTRPCNHVHTRPDTSTASVNSQPSSPGLEAASSEVARKEPIFIVSDGTPAGVPNGAVAFFSTTTPPDGWQEENSDGADTDPRPPFLKGATGDGSLALAPYAAHTHNVADHTHGGTSHSHTSANTGWATSYSGSTGAFSGSTIYYAAYNHTHSISVSSAATASLSSASGGTSGNDSTDTSNDPLWRAQTWVENISGGDSLPFGLIGMWLGPLVSIPAAWRLCNGEDGTPNLCQGRYLRHRGGGAPGATGGGTGHAHTTPSHTHGTSGHSHSVSFGSATTSYAEYSFWEIYVSRPRTSHTHGSSSTNSTTPAVGSSTSGTSSSTALEPPYREVAFVMLVDATGENLADPYRAISEWSDETNPIILDDPTPALLWLRGATEGEIAVCPEAEYQRVRPFSAVQPPEGGYPIVLSGEPGGRDYTLTIPCLPADRETVEDILAGSWFWAQPVEGEPLYLSVVSESAEVLKVGRVTVITAECVATGPEPLDDPEVLLP